MNYIYVHKVDTELLRIIYMHLMKKNVLYVYEQNYEVIGMYMYSFSVCTFSVLGRRS